MARIKSPFPERAAVLSGNLGSALEKHAYQRARYYFLYAWYLSALYAQLRNRNATNKPITSFVLSKATHQIGTGFRSGDPQHAEWVADPAVVNLPVTSFRKTDAAHLCNLGLSPTLRSLVDAKSDIESRFLDGLVRFMGATRQMPQKINTGTDRVVDKLHSRLILTDLISTQPLPNMQAINRYMSQAAIDLRRYKQERLSGKPGLAACAQCYIDFYNSANSAQRLYSEVATGKSQECRALKLDPNTYTPMA